MREKRNACRIFGGEGRRKEAIGKTNIKMDVRVIGWDGVD
jgi:hypothetical protein